MTDNGTPFVAIVRTMLSRFQRSLAELRIRHIRTQIDTPWTNGKVEAFWATLQSEVLDRQHLADLAAAEAAVTAYAGYYNYHRLHGELDWQTPAERFDGTPFTDRGFAKRARPRPDRIPAGCHPGRLRCLIFTGERQLGPRVADTTTATRPVTARMKPMSRRSVVRSRAAGPMKRRPPGVRPDGLQGIHHVSRQDVSPR